MFPPVTERTDEPQRGDFMLRVVERTYYQQEEIKTLDSRIREAGVTTYSLARKGAVDYPTYELYNEVREERINEAKEKYGESYYYHWRDVETYFHYLGKFFSDLEEIEKYLEKTVTYKPHREELKQAMERLDKRFEQVINEFWYSLGECEDITEDVLEQLKEGDCTVHCEFLIKEFKRFVNVICRIIRQNEINHKEF